MRLTDGDIIFLGYRTSFFVTRDRSIFVFGSNQSGRLGLEPPQEVMVPTIIDGFKERVIDVSSGFEHSLFLVEGGRLYATGYNNVISNPLTK